MIPQGVSLNNIPIEQYPLPTIILQGRDLVVQSANTKFIDSLGFDWSIIGQPIRVALPGLAETNVSEKLLTAFDTVTPFEQQNVSILIACNGHSEKITFDLICSFQVED